MSADFKIPDPRVSRFHALVERIEEGQIKITDLGSSQGTFVNGQKIVEKILNPKDEIKISNLTLKIQWTTIIPEALREALSGESRTLTPAPVGSSMDPISSIEKLSSSETIVRKPEMTQVSSLKEIARTRGVLDTVGKGVELEVTVYWENTILAVDHLGASNKEIYIGSDQRSQYVIPDGENIPYFKFLDMGSSEADLYLHPAFQGSVRINGVMSRFEDLRAQGKNVVRIRGADIAKIQVGQVNVFLMFVPEPPVVAMAPVLEREPFFMFVMASMFLLVAMLLAIAYFNQDPVEGKVVEIPEKLRKILIQ
jgi:hypothetical protein